MTATLKVLEPYVIGLQLGRINAPAALAIIERYERDKRRIRPQPTKRVGPSVDGIG